MEKQYDKIYFIKWILSYFVFIKNKIYIGGLIYEKN